jgi:hypothetical protein
MTLILDMTLNYLTEDTVQGTLKKLKPFIEKGQLEFFGIISLAKLMQLGADNFSGGVCVYLGNPNNSLNDFTIPTFPPASPQKSAFFSLLIEHFQDITKRYFKQVRKNANWMYKKLTEDFATIKEETGFCAMETIFNTDEGTVYVGISFKPLCEKCKRKEDIVVILQDLLLKMAGKLGLPLTKRQSFGFSLSNMSRVCESIRFSIGVENQALLKQYIELISCFSNILSNYAIIESEKFDIHRFASFVNDSLSIISGEINFNKNDLEVYNLFYENKLKHNAELCFNKKNGLYVNIPSEKNNFLKIEQKYIGISYDTDDFNDHTWSKPRLIELFFNIQCLDKPLHIQIKNDEGTIKCAIGGVFCYGYSCQLDDRGEIKFNLDKDETSEIKIKKIEYEIDSATKLNYFKVTLKDDIEFEGNNVLINETKDKTPFTINKCSGKSTEFNDILKKCACHKLTASLSEDKKSVTLNFGENNHCDYKTKIGKDNLTNAIDFLNNLQLEKLPFDTNYSWLHPKSPWNSLCKALKMLGENIIFGLTADDIKILNKINSNHEKCKKRIIYGMFKGLLNGYLDKKELDLETAKYIAQIFEETDLEDNFKPFALPLRHNFADWIIKISDWNEKNSFESNEDSINRLKPYIIALYPSIARSYNTLENSLDICNWILLQKLVDQNNLKDLKIGYSANHEKLSFYLHFYTTYSMDEKYQKIFLDELKKLIGSFDDWILNPKTLHSPLDDNEIFDQDASPNYEYHDITGVKDQEKIQTFFDKIGGKTILLEALKNDKDSLENDKDSIEKKTQILEAGFQWAIMTQDPDLFSELFEIYSSDSLEEYKQTLLSQYKIYFKTSDSGDSPQAKLLNLKL